MESLIERPAVRSLSSNMPPLNEKNWQRIQVLCPLVRYHLDGEWLFWPPTIESLFLAEYSAKKRYLERHEKVK